jgi:hydroxyacylglutathione hydrolase
METLDFFSTGKIAQHITCITGVTGELMYLVEGSDRAALIDTGVGLGDLKGLVAGLTAKPLIVLLTHGHLDHAGGASAFSAVYMNPADRRVLAGHQDRALQADYARMILGDRFALIRDDDYAAPASGNFLPLLPGDIFELGGITLEICEGKGHTPGSVTILLTEERTLLLGDACNPFTFLFDENSSPVAEYRGMLLRLRDQLDGRFDRVLLSHRQSCAPREMIESVIAVCDDILAGRADDMPFEFMGHQAVVAKAMVMDLTHPGRLDGGLGNIVYNRSRIR